MTLLEVIVALAVSGATLATGAAVLGFLTDQQDRSGVQPIAAANAVRETLRGWITNAQLSTQGDAMFRGTSSSSSMSNRSSDELTFVTSEIGTGGIVVHLHIAHDSLHGLVAELTPWRTGARPTVVGLAPTATGMRIRYLGSTGGEKNWERGWITTSVLPAAARIEIQFDHTEGDRAAQAMLSIPITVALGVRR